MPWRHRVVRRKTTDPDEPWEYSIREFFYDERNDDGTYENAGWTADPIPALGDSEDTLQHWLHMMLKAFSEPTITEDADVVEKRNALVRMKDIYDLLDMAEVLNYMILKIEQRGAVLIEDEDVRLDNATAVLEAMRKKHGNRPLNWRS